MAHPTFVTISQPTTEDRPVFLVDIPRDLNHLLLWMYELAKENSFPVQMNLVGQSVTFSSLAEMLGYAKGLKQTSELLFESEPLLS